jgi:hypothetical protein
VGSIPDDVIGILIDVLLSANRTNRPETLGVEPKEEVDTDEKAHIFYKVRWEKLSRK